MGIYTPPSPGSGEIKVGIFLPPWSGKVRVNWSPAVLRRQTTHTFSSRLQAPIYFTFSDVLVSQETFSVGQLVGRRVIVSKQYEH